MHGCDGVADRRPRLPPLFPAVAANTRARRHTHPIPLRPSPAAAGATAPPDGGPLPGQDAGNARHQFVPCGLDAVAHVPCQLRSRLAGGERLLGDAAAPGQKSMFFSILCSFIAAVSIEPVPAPALPFSVISLFYSRPFKPYLATDAEPNVLCSGIIVKTRISVISWDTFRHKRENEVARAIQPDGRHTTIAAAPGDTRIRRRDPQ